jgi:hypothetical protein
MNALLSYPDNVRRMEEFLGIKPFSSTLLSSHSTRRLWTSLLPLSSVFFFCRPPMKGNQRMFLIADTQEQRRQRLAATYTSIYTPRPFSATNSNTHMKGSMPKPTQ